VLVGCNVVGFIIENARERHEGKKIPFGLATTVISTSFSFDMTVSVPRGKRADLG